MNARLNIVIAHNLEAKYPVHWLDLQRIGDTPKHYSDGKGINLVVSGEGQACSSDAVEFLASLATENLPTAWLNFGIAGHQSLSLGTVFVPDKIRQASSGDLLYTAPLLDMEDRGLLVTVNEPELNYPEDAAYDMEGFAFWQNATKHSSLELVQCLKIVSDNKKQPAPELDLNKLEDTLRNAESTFINVVGQMQSLLARCPLQFPYPDLYSDILNSTHFTVTQQSQLKRLLQRYHALNLQQELEKIDTSPDSAQSCISALEDGLSGKL